MSQDNKHTPGPWLITGEDGCTIYAVHHNGDFKDGKPFLVNRFYARVENCRFQGGTADEARANGRLIAAAPDLLDAALMLDSLETRMDHGDADAAIDWPHAMTALRAAIAKAIGSAA